MSSMSTYPPFGLGLPHTDLRRQLVAAALAGAKTTTAGLLDEYERDGDDVPAAGHRFILQGFAGEPVAVIEIVEARVIAASAIDVQFVRDEGEGVETVEDWRKAHERFLGRAIAPETMIVALRFRVVERVT
jgi:uncharacterized protein YhfF